MRAAPLRVAFLGPAGTHTEEALRASAPLVATRLEPRATVWETVMAVHRREVDRAVVPIENALEGSVSATLDTLAAEATEVRIAAEVVHPIRHCLIARHALDPELVELVVSHPQATAQCERFLRKRLPGAARQSAPSTADAVRLVTDSSEPWAALGSLLAARIYGGEVLAEGVEDRPDNLTRFVWLAPRGDRGAPTAPATKTSVVFWGFNDESPGALVAILSEFADRGVNLTKIESRPSRVGLGHYKFFADLDGAEDDPSIIDALAGLRRRVAVLRVLGSYGQLGPRAGGGAGG